MITYLLISEDDIREEVCEVRAHSESQAIFMAPCAPDDIIDIELVVVKKASIN